MLNYLRADLYRSWKSGTPIGMVGALFGVLILVVGMDAAAYAGLLPGNAAVGGTVNGSFASLAASSLFNANYLPLLSAWCTAYLVASDYKNGSHKTMLAIPRARTAYVGSKVAFAALVSAVLCALALALAAVLPPLFGLRYASVPSVGETLGWWGCATLVCLGYGAACTLLALLTRNETLGWCLALFMGLGLVDITVIQLVGLAALFVSELAPLARAVTDGMLVTWSSTVSTGTGFLANAGAVAHVALVPLAWTVGAGLLAHLSFRRKAL